MTQETHEIVGEHLPECNDKCDGDNHYMLGSEDEPEKAEQPKADAPWSRFFKGLFS